MKSEKRKVKSEKFTIFEYRTSDDMEAIYKLNTSELNNKLLESIKKLFGRQDVIIQIRSLTDETSYLFDNLENKKHLFLLKKPQEIQNQEPENQSD